ncbi:MAG: SHOCT domain-containing protein [Alphaproteobacteria bacterium]
MHPKSIAYAALFLLSNIVPAAAQGPEVGFHPHHFGGAGYFIGPIMMILMVAVIVGIVLLAVRGFSGSARTSAPPHAPSGRTPIDILQERFARGEIDKDEFEERRRILGT